MDNSIDLLHKELQEKVARLDKERAKKTAAFTEEQEKQRALEEKIRVERVRTIKEAEERVIAAKKLEAEREAIRIKEATEARLRAEQVQNGQLELAQQEEEKAGRIRLEIANTEFAEEQHRKALELARIPVINLNISEDESVIDAHILTGEAAVGTEGLEVGPNMSPHLKRILRIINNQ